MPWFWKRRREAPPSVTLPPTADQLLLNSFLELERTRLERRGDLEAKRDELEVRKLEIEMNHLEVKTKMEIEHERAREELRAIKREAGKRGAITDCLVFGETSPDWAPYGRRAPRRSPAR